MKGLTTLISTIVIGAIGVTVVTSILLLGTATTRTAIVLDQSQKAKQYANACGEAALQVLHDNFAYTGTASINPLGDGNCSYVISNGGGENRTINASSTVGNVTRKIQIDITQLTGSIVASWKEIQ